MQWPGFEIQVTREDILDTSRNPLESATSRALQGTRFEGLQVNVWEERLTVQNYPGRMRPRKLTRRISYPTSTST